jgi:hypothetical protein
MKKKSKYKKETISFYASLKRESMLEAGAYDGRFRTRTVEDKKKRKNKLECRKFKYAE